MRVLTKLHLLALYAVVAEHLNTVKKEVRDLCQVWTLIFSD